ncbi:MAG: LysM peptidoglycan-binding domain-containing protein [Chloroflexi bacterium]|nr:LysM peptidoglycan-binding domain-containing protein [Chloroflexota bacterium]
MFTRRNFLESRAYYLLLLLCLLLLTTCTSSGEGEGDVEPPHDSGEATPVIAITPLSDHYQVIIDVANLRTGPGVEYSGAGKVHEGDVVKVDGVLATGDWYRLEGEEERWISSDFVLFITNPEISGTESVTEEKVEPVDAPTETAPVIEIPPTQIVCSGSPTGWQIYIIQSGDTLFALSNLIGSSVEEIMHANCLEDTVLFTGQSLYLPRLPATAVPLETPLSTPSTVPIDTPTFTPTAAAATASPTTVPIDTPTFTPTVAPATPSPTTAPVDTPTFTPTASPTAIPIDTATFTPPPNVTGEPPAITPVPQPTP